MLLTCAGKLFVVPSHRSDKMDLSLRTTNGFPIQLDFGKPLTALPAGLKSNQAVDVVAIFDKGALPRNPQGSDGSLWMVLSLTPSTWCMYMDMLMPQRILLHS